MQFHSQRSIQKENNNNPKAPKTLMRQPQKRIVSKSSLQKWHNHAFSALSKVFLQINFQIITNIEYWGGTFLPSEGYFYLCDALIFRQARLI